MRISLLSPVRKSAFLSGSITAAVLVWALCWQGLAEHVSTQSASIEGFERAARIQPLNAYSPRVIGAALIQKDVQQAISYLEQSAHINPHASLTWLELSKAYGVAGEKEKQRQAILKALAADPTDVGVEWDASIYLIQNGAMDQGLNLLREVLSNDASKVVPGLQVAYGATGGDIQRTLEAIPASAGARLNFMRWLTDRQQLSAADRVWPSVAATEGNLRAQDFGFYLDSLIARRQVAQAKSVWATLQSRDPEVQHRIVPGNLVVNGDFEDNFLNSGLSWRYTRIDGVAVSMDTSNFHAGTRSLAMQFDSDNVSDAGLYELIPVNPSARYVLSGFTHSEELVSANGVRLAVTDYYSNEPLWLGDEILGSTSWRETSGEFTTRPGTTLVKLSVVRSPAFGRIRGQLWIDDLRLEPRP